MPFLQVDYRYLKNPEYLRFQMTPAHITWFFLRARIYRPAANGYGHPDYIGFYNEGWLAAHTTLNQLEADWLGERTRRGILGDLDRLQTMRLIEYYPSQNRQPSVFRLGSWEEFTHPGRERRVQRIEVLYADRLFLLDESEPWARA